MTGQKAAVERREARVCAGRLRIGFRVVGSGPGLVYFQAGGPAPCPLLDRLAEDFTVHVLELPGTSPGDPYAVRELDGLWDLVLACEEALRALELTGAPAIGHGFGGMLAAEIAACYPEAFAKLVLVAPLGLWLDETPVADWMAAAPTELPRLLFADPEGPVARAAVTPPDDPEAAITAASASLWATGCVAKFIWPIPDRGLAGRLHRIAAPTLLLWGEQDRLNPVVYAEEFARRIAGSVVKTIPECGHMPQWEQPADTHHAIADFLS
ncbi:hypothetical protein ACM01_23890 [Streptomyces viridochromogenes]|jgi:pimeloyl-ACP methyl ester carboxylesterase|uniref:AB hydrolase-1 domain-containing protein n=1 Tax=Streptomyces viridochromogenes TaxID=1938 RepID=A0A0J7Z988_STRVR|nr:alpha/beta hydrolase [Streptomyces viridochromogenes]KMS72379.1 hypothetical protein ACM01_23890 [Streptomyces viridochromogenes]KOG16338.1 hypothetical protein ADK36_27815 [Streptomyces viridochromogenes]KOG16874.1 hypothetical protein ADK35_26010 [Streptomyces viridochromogenes]